MSVNITAVVKDGGYRMVQRNGLALIGLLFVLSIINGFVNSLITFGAGQSASLLVNIVSIGGSLAVSIVSIVALRVFVSDETDHLPREHFTHNIGSALLNLVVGGLVFGLAVVIGLVLVVIPGLFLLVCLYFWTIYVAVEDESFITGFQESWALTREHRLTLFATGAVVVVLAILLGAIFGFIGGIIGGVVAVLLGLSPVLVGSAFGSAFATPIVSVFTLATTAAAYTQLRAPDEAQRTAPSTGPEGSSIADSPPNGPDVSE